MASAAVGLLDGQPRFVRTVRSTRRPRQAALPTAYRELLERIYANVGLSIEAGAGQTPVEGDAVTSTVDEPRSLGFLRVRRWDEGPTRR